MRETKDAGQPRGYFFCTGRLLGTRLPSSGRGTAVRAGGRDGGRKWPTAAGPAKDACASAAVRPVRGGTRLKSLHASPHAPPDSRRSAHGRLKAIAATTMRNATLITLVRQKAQNLTQCRCGACLGSQKSKQAVLPLSTVEAAAVGLKTGMAGANLRAGKCSHWRRYGCLLRCPRKRAGRSGGSRPRGA